MNAPYLSRVVFDPYGILLAVYTEKSCEGGRDCGRGSMSKTRAKLEWYRRVCRDG